MAGINGWLITWQFGDGMAIVTERHRGYSGVANG